MFNRNDYKLQTECKFSFKDCRGVDTGEQVPQEMSLLTATVPDLRN